MQGHKSSKTYIGYLTSVCQSKKEVGKDSKGQCQGYRTQVRWTHVINEDQKEVSEDKNPHTVFESASRSGPISVMKRMNQKEVPKEVEMGAAVSVMSQARPHY